MIIESGRKLILVDVDHEMLIMEEGSE